MTLGFIITRCLRHKDSRDMTSIITQNRKSFFLIAFVLAACLLLAGCMNAVELNRQVINDQTIADKALKKIEPKPHRAKALVVDNRPWYGARAVPIQNGEPLPPLLISDDGVVDKLFNRRGRSTLAAKVAQIIDPLVPTCLQEGFGATLRPLLIVDRLSLPTLGRKGGMSGKARPGSRSSPRTGSTTRYRSDTRAWLSRVASPPSRTTSHRGAPLGRTSR